MIPEQMMEPAISGHDEALLRDSNDWYSTITQTQSADVSSCPPNIFIDCLNFPSSSIFVDPCCCSLTFNSFCDGDGLADGNAAINGLPYELITTHNCLQQSMFTDPSLQDTDSDGLRDGLEHLFTDPCSRDTDQDGIQDATEDANYNGRRDWGETCAVISDSDWDCLADGWKDYGEDHNFSTHDTGEMDGIRQSYEALGEDLNFSGTNDPLEPSPLKEDSDGDGVGDCSEVNYLANHGYPTNHDADGDGIPDVLEKDADADGLRDSIENSNLDDCLDNNESDPYDFDTDNDSLPDGMEPSPYLTIDADNLVNANDSNSNNDNDPDGLQSFILLRTNALDSNGDGLLDFGPGTNISSFDNANPDIYSMPNSLSKYSYYSTGSLGESATSISVEAAEADPFDLRTPDNRAVYLQTGSPDIIYIHQSGSTYYIYHENSGAEISDSIHVNWVNGHHNEVADRQIVVDTRMATCTDTDHDELKNELDPDSNDRDTDDDGIIDSRDLNATNPDMDGDGLPDGLETGTVTTVVGIGTAVDGTDTDATFTWNVNTFQVSVHNFTADVEPVTTTDPNNSDSDGDGVSDGIEDTNMTALALGGHTLISSDLNGKYDGMTLNETDPLDLDTDDDGLLDGTEDADHDGLWDWIPSTFIGETCSWAFDSDGDNLGDGLESGKNFTTITSYTNTSIFVPDSNSTTTTNPLKIDTDSDGVPDGWIDGWTFDPANHPTAPFGIYNVPDHEFSFGEGEDKNLNGAFDAGETNPNSLDTDGDHLADGWDILSDSASLNPIYYTTESGIYRYWGELNFTTHLLGTRDSANVYQSAPTDPTNIDSDGDGLVDGNIGLNGLPCELVTSHNGVSQTMCTDPSLQDTDSDGLSDGLEISGWEVHIIKETTKQEQKNWTTYSNPTIADTDLDGLNDYFEFENQSDPTKNDTDGDYILDCDELQGQLTQIEGTPPEILKVDGTHVRIEIIYHYSDTWLGKVCTSKEIKITVRAKDTAGLDHVIFKLEGQKDQIIFLDDHPKIADVCATFSYDEWRGLADGWDINVTAFDRNGNGNCTLTHLDGFFEGVVKALLKGFWALVEAVGKFLSEMWNWVVNMFKKLFSPVFDGITRILTDISNAVYNEIASLFIRNLNKSESSGRALPTWSCEIAEYVKCGASICKDLILLYLSVKVITLLLTCSGILLDPIPPVYCSIIMIVGIGLGVTIGMDIGFSIADLLIPAKKEEPAKTTEYKNTDALSDIGGLVATSGLILYSKMKFDAVQEAKLKLGLIDTPENKAFQEMIIAMILLMCDKFFTSIFMMFGLDQTEFDLVSAVTNGILGAIALFMALDAWKEITKAIGYSLNRWTYITMIRIIDVLLIMEAGLQLIKAGIDGAKAVNAFKVQHS